MALSPSVLWDGVDLRDLGVELEKGPPRGLPEVRPSLVDLPSRSGAIPFGGRIGPRTVNLTGYVRAATHAALETNLALLRDLLRPEIAEDLPPGGGTARGHRLVFGDRTDRYYVARVVSCPLPSRVPHWMTSPIVDFRLRVSLAMPFGLGETRREHIGTAGNTVGAFPYENPGEVASPARVTILGEQATTRDQGFSTHSLTLPFAAGLAGKNHLGDAITAKLRRAVPLVSDWDMRKSGTSDWGTGSGTTLTKVTEGAFYEGTKILRIVQGASGWAKTESVSVSAGNSVRFFVRLRQTSGSSTKVSLWSNTGELVSRIYYGASTTDWVVFDGSTEIPAGVTSVWINFGDTDASGGDTTDVAICSIVANELENPTFQDWTAGVPDHWTLSSGTILEDTGTYYRGYGGGAGKSAKLTCGGGGFLLKQTLSSMAAGFYVYLAKLRLVSGFTGETYLSIAASGDADGEMTSPKISTAAGAPHSTWVGVAMPFEIKTGSATRAFEIRCGDASAGSVYVDDVAVIGPFENLATPTDAVVQEGRHGSGALTLREDLEIVTIDEDDAIAARGQGTLCGWIRVPHASVDDPDDYEVYESHLWPLLTMTNAQANEYLRIFLDRIPSSGPDARYRWLVKHFSANASTDIEERISFTPSYSHSAGRPSVDGSVTEWLFFAVRFRSVADGGDGKVYVDVFSVDGDALYSGSTTALWGRVPTAFDDGWVFAGGVTWEEIFAYQIDLSDNEIEALARSTAPEKNTSTKIVLDATLEENDRVLFDTDTLAASFYDASAGTLTNGASKVSFPNGLPRLAPGRFVYFYGGSGTATGATVVEWEPRFD